MKLIISLIVWTLSLGFAHGATWYQNCASGNDANGGTSFSDAVLTSTRAAALMSGGDTVYIAAGTCSNNFTLSAYDKGSAGNYTVVAGTSPLGVSGTSIVGPTITTAQSLTGNTSWYIRAQDMRFSGTNDDSFEGWQFQAKRIEFLGGCTSGNCANVSVGDNAFMSGNMLFEDCIFQSSTTGSGRYQFLVFFSTRIVVRQNIFTTRNGWSGDVSGSQPAALAVSYNSGAISWQNNIAMDVVDYPRDPDESWHGAYYWVTNSGLSFDTGYNEWLGNIAHNIAGSGFQNDGSQNVTQTAKIENMLINDCTDFAMALGNGSNSRNYTISNVTVILSSKTASTVGIGKYQSGSATLTNAIIANMPTDALDGISATYFDDYNNGGTETGTGQVTYDPRTNGLSYYPRIETGSNLKTAGSGGGQIGAEIVYQYGVKGTMWGDTDFNTLSGTALWPLAYEAERKVLLCNTRGFGICGTTYTLTEWVNGYGASPYDGTDVSSPTAPGTPTVSSTGTTTFDISWTASTDNVGVDHYNIDVSTDNFTTFSAGYNDFNMGSGTTEQLTGLTASTSYVFRIRAVDAAGNTSNSSTSGNGVTSSISSSPSLGNTTGVGIFNTGTGTVTWP